MRERLSGILLRLLRTLFRLLYRVEVRGLESLPAPGVRAVIICNHVAWLDGPLLAAFLPGKPVFAVNTHYAAKWWMRRMLRFVDTLTLDPTNPMAAKTLIRVVNEGRTCVIFPEGRLTVTGALMKIYEGPGMIAEKAGALVIPARINGAQFTRFTRLKGKFRRRLFPKIRISLLEPRRLEIPSHLRGRRRRHAIGLQLYDTMSDMMFDTEDHRRTVFDLVLEARHLVGGKSAAIEDIQRRPLSYNQLIAGALTLGHRIARFSKPEETIGLLLPNAAFSALVFFAVQTNGSVPAMLNYTSGISNLNAACATAQISVVITARVFVERAQLSSLVEQLEQQVRVVYVEDLKEQISLADKIHGLVALWLSHAGYRAAHARPDDSAVILFTSGTEDAPKGVVLSHANILSNCFQLASRIDFSPADVAFNALPLFHSFGLTGGFILPLISGVRTFMYPSPLHYRVIPEFVYETNATIMFGTDAFLAGYARYGNPYDFFAMRYVFAGGERVRNETRDAWMEKFGLRIFEGYGVTECSPALAVNTPMHYRAGTVGRILPGIKYRIEPIPGMGDAGRLVVSGPNVMLGYLKADRPGELQAVAHGWYDTGDVVRLEADGFLTIIGRAKRFAKVAGEMISLRTVEDLAFETWPDSHHAVVALPDSRKGDRLVLLTDAADAARDDLLRQARMGGFAMIMVPEVILNVRELPLLGSGKIDYRKTLELAKSMLADAEHIHDPTHLL